MLPQRAIPPSLSLLGPILLGLSLPLLLLLDHALAHHPLGMPNPEQYGPLMGVISGVGHTLLGPDHLLFLLSIGFGGRAAGRHWVLPLVGCGLLGALLSQLAPFALADGVVAVTETLVALSLVVSALVTLGRCPVLLLLPLIALHGYVLGGAVIGAEPTPLIAYLLGLALGQGLLLFSLTAAARRLLPLLQEDGQRLLAGVWIGVGAAFAWSVIIA